MTQHIVKKASELCKYKNNAVDVIFGFDRPLNEMFFNIIIEIEFDGEIEEDCISFTTTDVDEWKTALESSDSAEFVINPKFKELIIKQIIEEFTQYNQGININTNQQRIYFAEEFK